MKRIFCFLLLLFLSISLVGCANHNDGVCDIAGCDTTIGVVRYDKNHELCLSHSLEQGNNGADGYGVDDNDNAEYIFILVGIAIVVVIIIIIGIFSIIA